MTDHKGTLTLNQFSSQFGILGLQNYVVENVHSHLLQANSQCDLALGIPAHYRQMRRKFAEHIAIIGHTYALRSYTPSALTA